MIRLDTWLNQLGLDKYLEVFEELEVDMEVMADLTEADLEKINIPLGPRKKLVKAIAALSASAESSTRNDTESGPERRQLTVMFCDLVGSTSLSERLDPEDLSEILNTYRRTCEKVINRYSGTTARYMGDGLLVYFGYPYAHEDDAERAVRAGLEMVEAIGNVTEFDHPLAIRVGIATGSVVVGEIIGEGSSLEHAIYGETPNLAARLQSQAQPNSIVISNQTWQLAGAMFECNDLGPTRLKGFSEPVQLWQPTSLKAIESRFEASLGRIASAEFIGRRDELESMKDLWHKTTNRNGQLVTLCAEAGMGKSRLIHEFRNAIGTEQHTLVRYYCTPYYQNSALYPVVTQLERAAGFERSDSAETKIIKLKSVLNLTRRDVDSTIALFASLLAIPLPVEYPVVDLTPALQREKTIEALADQFLALSVNRPALVIFEDLHWIDPTSLDLLLRVIPRIVNTRTMIMVTSRPEYQPPWTDLAHNSTFTLNRLDRNSVQRLVLAVTHGKPLPDQLVNSIVAKSDGTPLFVEELTKAVIAGDFLTDTGTRYELNQSLPPLAVPNTLKDSLMARLNHTASVRETAQIGAVLGRSFHYQLLAEVSPLSEPVLQRSLLELQEADLLSARGIPPKTSYTFRHALVQDASYDSLLRTARLSLHKRIATHLEAHFPEVAANEPELLAHHYTSADLTENAVMYWYKAGQHAVGRSNYLESVNHCRRGLELLDKCPPSRENSEQELKLRAILGVALVATKGYAADDISENYARSRDVCDQLGETPALVPTLYGLWVFHLLRGHRSETFELASQLYQYASDQSLPLVTSSALAISTFYTGDRRDADRLLRESMQRFDENQHTTMALTYGDDADLLPALYHYWNQWLCGYPRQALDSLHKADAQIERIGTPYLVATGMLFHMILKHELGDTEGVAASATRFEQHSTEQGFPFFAALSNIGSAWSRVQTSHAKTNAQSNRSSTTRNSTRTSASGDSGNNGSYPNSDIEAIKQGAANFRLTGARLPVSYWLHYLVQAQLECGDIAAGLETVEEALQLTSELLDDFYKPELLRLKGELLLLKSNATEAKLCFEQALALTRQTHSKMLELRAVISLARLLAGSGEADKAKELLSTCYDWFTEGFDCSSDLIAARAMLNSIDQTST